MLHVALLAMWFLLVSSLVSLSTWAWRWAAEQMMQGNCGSFLPQCQQSAVAQLLRGLSEEKDWYPATSGKAPETPEMVEVERELWRAPCPALPPPPLPEQGQPALVLSQIMPMSQTRQICLSKISSRGNPTPSPGN